MQILLIATLLTLCIEMPFQNVKKLIFNDDRYSMKSAKGNKRKDAKVG